MADDTAAAPTVIEEEVVEETEVTEKEIAQKTVTEEEQAEPKEEAEPQEAQDKDQPEEEEANQPAVEDKPSEETEEKQAEGEEKTPDAEPTQNGTTHGDAVAKHYNENPQVSKEGRKESQIFHLRNFNNWVKSVMINEYLEKLKRNKKHKDDLNVLDLGCGKGGDYLKWHKGAVNHVICADIAETSLEQCKERYQSLKRGDDSRRHRESTITTEFIHADCTKKRLRESYENADIQLDMTSCQFAYHYSFESMEQADMMLQNACENLKDGGYFIGTTPDAYKLVQRIRATEEDSFGNDIYSISFENKEEFSLFGAKYNFKLDDVVDCPEFMVHFPTLEKLAEKYNMKLVYKKNFHELFQEKHEDFSGLLYRMQALECLPARDGKSLTSQKEGAYEGAKELHSNPPSTTDPKYKTLGTLSKDEWEATGLYLAFAFQKCNPKPEGEKTDDNPAEKDDVAADDNKQGDATDAKMSDEAETTKVEQEQQEGDGQKEESADHQTEQAPQEISEEATEAVPQCDVQESAEDVTEDEPAAKRSRPSEDE